MAGGRPSRRNLQKSKSNVVTSMRGAHMKILSFAAIALAAVAMLTAQTGNRQVTQNELSPTADTSVTIGGTHITIEYNAPSARGREVEGGLIPYAEIYR